MSFLEDGVVDHLRAVADAPDVAGTKYRVIRKLGSGGMGTVYLVEDGDLGRQAAMKVLALPDTGGDLSSRLLAEARLISRMEHPYIVPVHDVGTLPDGRVYYVMKLVRGRRLDEWMREDPPRPARLRLFQKICEAVAFAHARGIIHRDLKPENVMMGPLGEALVMDWGVAKVAGDAPGPAPPAPADAPAGGRVSGLATIALARDAQGQTRHGAVIGTPAYMAPEQARGETDRIDERTDVYALGAMLFYLLGGRPPFAGDNAAEILAEVRLGRPPGLRECDASVPKPLDAVCRKAMAADPDGRYRTAEEMALDVGRYLDGRAVAAYRETLLDRASRLLTKNRALVLLILAYLLMRVVVLLLAGR